MTKRILIIDDNPDDIEAIKRFIANEAAYVRVVTDSKQSEVAFLEFEPDLVLLDLHMPAPDGATILRRLAPARERLGFLPVIVLTGDHGASARDRALVLGANDFLTKPLARTDVLLRVRNMLRTRQLFVDLTNANRALERRAGL
ncbi:MAG TPA: response regulator [Candidatus Dormibacteraeota bacterium]|jgi:putative two-component system response regulator